MATRSEQQHALLMGVEVSILLTGFFCCRGSHTTKLPAYKKDPEKCHDGRSTASRHCLSTTSVPEPTDINIPIFSTDILSSYRRI